MNPINKFLKRVKRKLIENLGHLLRFHSKLYPQRRVQIIIGSESTGFLADILSRLSFYAPELTPRSIDILTSFSYRSIIGQPLVLDFSSEFSRSTFHRQLANLVHVDHRRCIAAWEWVRLSSLYCPVQYSTTEAIALFSLAASKVFSFKYNKAYIFGTGPSLAHAHGRNWDDGVRIVCNTIVRDSCLFKHINPHFIVAGDALYHFSETAFAKEFRKDLKARLQDSDCYFVYPSNFDSVVQRELGILKDRLIGIPCGGVQSAAVDLLSDFRLPSLGNVLGLLLLPLATTFSQRVELCGFDGRSPADNENPFWANSSQHSYPELMHTLKDSYPFFFEHFVPGNNSQSYVSSVHGDVLDELMASAEDIGFVFKMLHPSWTATLNKRYPGSCSPRDYTLNPTASLLR